jgi:hypothetical protein
MPDEYKTLKRFLKKGLSYDPNKRFKSDEQMLDMYDKGIANINIYRRIMNQFNWIAIPGAVVAGIASLVIYTSKLPEQKPIPNEVKKGIMYTTSGLPYKLMIFERDTTFEVSKIDGLIGISNETLRECSNNSYIAHLLKTYREAFDINRSGGDLVNEYQHKILGNLDYNPTEDAKNRFGNLMGAAKCIEFGISKSYMSKPDSIDSKTSFGVVDLEDACTISRLGEHTVNMAKAQAKSKDYKDYRKFLPEGEASFIDTWMSRIRLE